MRPVRSSYLTNRMRNKSFPHVQVYKKNVSRHVMCWMGGYGGCENLFYSQICAATNLIGLTNICAQLVVYT